MNLVITENAGNPYNKAIEKPYRIIAKIGIFCFQQKELEHKANSMILVLHILQLLCKKEFLGMNSYPLSSLVNSQVILG